MKSLQAPGIGSGLDINGIVTQLMELERRPIELLDEKESTIDAKVSAFGQLKSKLAEFQTAMKNLGSEDKFKIYAATSTDEDVLAITASSQAAKGRYSIDVNRIAENHKLASAAFADFDSTTISAGSPMSIKVGEASFDIDVNGKTLGGIRDEINNSTENNSVTASIIKEDGGYRLMLTADETGSENFIEVTNDPLTLATLNQDRDESGGFNKDDLDAVMTFENTFTVTRSSNKVSDLISGVTLDIKKPGNTVLAIGRDDEAINESIQLFADAFNALRDEIDLQRDEELEADSVLSSIEARIFGVLNSGAGITGSSLSSLSEAGLSIDKEGRMQLENGRLTEQMNLDFNSVVNLFAADGEGFANRLQTMADRLLETNGLIDNRESGFKDRLRQIEDQKFRLEERMLKIEDRLRKQFSTLDTFVSQMNSTGAFLTQQLSSPNA